MVTTNNIKKELSNYNKELEKYISKVSYNSVEDLSFEKLSDNQSTNLEVLTFIQDIRDEMSLLRKHLYSDVQSLVTKTLKADQDKQLSEMKKNFNSMIKEMAESKNYLLNKIRDEIANMHHDLKNTNMDVVTINSKIDTLVQAVYDANQNQISIQDDVSNRLKEIETELLVNQHVINGFNNSLKKEYMHFDNDSKTIPKVLGNESSKSHSTVYDLNKKIEEDFIEHRIARIDAALDKLK